MKKNTKFSASKKQEQSPRSPLKLKDLNVSTSSSSTATSISTEAPRGCLRFLLSHHSSAVSKNASNKKLTDKTPESAPSVKRLRAKLSCNGDNLVKNRAHLQNPEKPTSKNVQRLKKKPPTTPCLYSWKSGRKPSSRLDLSDNSNKKLCENAVNFTPGCGFDLGCETVKSGEKGPDSGDKCSPIPPIQASLSPEIQGGSTSVVKATPTTCYAAGHVLSGVSDKRKCRPRGLLTFGDNDLFGSNKTNDDGDIIGASNKPRVSLVPCPIEASMHWILSPCDERMSTDKDDDDGAKSVVRLNEPSKSIGSSSSPCSSLGFSSELCTTSDATTVSHGSRSRSSEFRGLLWPSFDHMVRNLSPSSPANVPSSMVEISPDQSKTTPCSIDSIGSGNVIQTPQSNTSSPNFVLSHLSRDEMSRLWFECELNSVAEVLRRVSLSPNCELPVLDSPRTSFEFNPLIRPDNSIDLTLFRKAMDTQASPEPLLHNLPESEVRISWREGLASRIFEMDELDCCRCFSDEEQDAAYSGSDACESTSCPQVLDSNSNPSDPESRKVVEETNPRLELSNDGGSSDVAEDVSWKVCENDLFQV